MVILFSLKAIYLTLKKIRDPSKVSDKPSTSKDDPGRSKAILISGPPGIGKTTAAHLVAQLEGFEPIEFNASDTRSKKSVQNVVKELTGSHTLTEYFKTDLHRSVSLYFRISIEWLF
jgi:DNA polymerase III delta prime subunit